MISTHRRKRMPHVLFVAMWLGIAIAAGAGIWLGIHDLPAQHIPGNRDTTGRLCPWPDSLVPINQRS